MKRLVMILAMFTLGAAAPAIAQTTTPQGSPAERPAPGTPHPPENRMEQTVPDMKSDKKEQHPPTNRVGEAVPPMKPGDKPSAGSGTTTSPSGTTTQ